MVVLVVNTDKNIQDSQLINTLGVPSVVGICVCPRVLTL